MKRRSLVFAVLLMGLGSTAVTLQLRNLKLSRIEQRQRLEELADATARRVAAEHEVALLSADLARHHSEGPLAGKISARRDGRMREMLARIVKSGALRDPQLPLNQIPSGPGGMVFPELMGDLKYGELIRIIWRASADASYSELIASLDLPEAEQTEFKRILLDRVLASFDIDAGMRRAGLDPQDPATRMERHRISTEINAGFENEIRALLSDSSYAQYRRYQLTRAPREALAAFKARLSYSEYPLRREQADQLIDLMDPTRHGRIHEMWTEGGLERAKEVLTSEQWHHLETLIAEMRTAYPERR